MTEKSYIPVFTGAKYKGWAFKIKFGLADKELHDIVMDWGESPRQAKRVVSPPLTQDELDALDAADVAQTVTARTQLIGRQTLVQEAWSKKDIAAMAYIVKHLQKGELTHVRNCETAADMWDALKAFYDIQGAIEIANAEDELTAIIMGEAEDLSDYVKRL